MNSENIYMQMKAAGKKKPLAGIEYEISADINSTAALITELVRQEVTRYNAKKVDRALVSFLT